jgi:hypothetical protein
MSKEYRRALIFMSRFDITVNKHSLDSFVKTQNMQENKKYICPFMQPFSIGINES